MTTPTSELKRIPYKQIRIPEEILMRGVDQKKAESIAASMKTSEIGQLEPIIVANGGESNQPYELVAGRHRLAAYEINGWEGREVDCVVRNYGKAGGVVARLVDMWAENVERSEVHPLDRAVFVLRMVEGTFADPPDPLDKEEICRRLNLSKKHLNNYLRLARNIAPDIAKAAKAAGAPMRLLVRLSELRGAPQEDDEDKEAEYADRARQQLHLFTIWHEREKALLAEGRQRSTRSDVGQTRGKRGKAEEDDEPKGLISGNQRIATAKYVDEDERSYKVDEIIEVTKAKYASLEKARGAAEQKHAEFFKGVLTGMRFAKGEIQAIPGLVKKDFDILREGD